MNAFYCFMGLMKYMEKTLKPTNTVYWLSKTTRALVGQNPLINRIVIYLFT